MNARKEHEAANETGRAMVDGTGNEPAFGDAEIRARAVDPVLEAGGEVTGVIVAAGWVWLHGRVGCRSEVATLQRTLAEIPGVTGVDLRLAYDIDDTGPNPGLGRGAEETDSSGRFP